MFLLPKIFLINLVTQNIPRHESTLKHNTKKPTLRNPKSKPTAKQCLKVQTYLTTTLRNNVHAIGLQIKLEKSCTGILVQESIDRENK